MSLRDWFATKRNRCSSGKHPEMPSGNPKLSDDDLCRLWTQCFNCRENLPTKELLANLQVCTQCGYHFRVGAWERIAQLTGEETGFQEWDADLKPADPLAFEDTQKYPDRQKEAQEKSGLNEAVVTGVAQIGRCLRKFRGGNESRAGPRCLAFTN